MSTVYNLQSTVYNIQIFLSEHHDVGQDYQSTRTNIPVVRIIGGSHYP